MTINSDWVAIIKEEVPDAFTAKPLFRCKCGYIDGMPLLMKGAATKRWEDLVRFNFVTAIRRLFKLGAEKVVLAFDDYLHVPSAKSITQANRSKKAVKFDFHERQELETVIPDDYNDRLRNRTYKRRVIEMIISRMFDNFGLDISQTLIVDYVNCPIEFMTVGGVIQHKYMTSIPPCGECDIKFTRWTRLYGDIVVHSIDGDFIPIALIEHEKQLQIIGKNGNPNRIAIYRMAYNMDKPKPKTKAQKLHARDDDSVDMKQSKLQFASSGSSSVVEKIPIVAKKREMEYADITLIYHAMRTAMQQCSPSSVTSSAHDMFYMRVFASLITLTGTDFTRSLPHLGPKTIWNLLSDKRIFPALIRSYDIHTMQLDENDACDMFVARIYSEKYPKHTCGNNTMHQVLTALHGSNMPTSRKSQLPSAQRVLTTIRNANWLLQYWECRQPTRRQHQVTTTTGAEDDDVWDYTSCYPDPICPEFGFKLSNNRLNAVQYLDV
jgi:hypothetical protein